MGAPSPVTSRRGAAGGGAPRGAPGSPTTTFAENRLTEESAEQEAGPAGCKSPIHSWHLHRQNMSKAYSRSVISHPFGDSPPISDDNYQSVKTFCLRIHLHSSDLSHYDPLFRNIINKEVIIILLGLKGFIVQPERDYLNIECCSYHHSLPLCTHLFWMLGFLQSQKLATVSGWIHTVTTNLTWTNVHAHDKHDV